MMEPLRVTATLVSPYAVPLYPIHLDGLLAAAECDRRGLIAGVGELQHVEVPLQRSECGRYHLASVGHHERGDAIAGHIHKRSPIPEMMWFGGPKVRSINTATGRNKSFRIPQPRALIDTITWWCVGDRLEVESLIVLVTHVGKKRSAGHGKVGRWVVEPCESWAGFPILRPDGSPMRNLPFDTEGLGEGAMLGWGPVTYPYYDPGRAGEVAQPPDVHWSGP